MVRALWLPTKAAPFKPSDLTEVFCWMDAGQGVTLTGGGNSVEQWASVVGSFDFVQATADQKPQLRSAGGGAGTGANSQPYLEFDGVDDRLVRNGVFSSDTKGEVFAVFNRSSPTADFTALFGLGLAAGSTPWWWLVGRADSAGAAIQVDTDSTSASNSAASHFRAGPTYLLNVRHDDTNVSFFKNRIASGSASAQSWFGDLSSHDRATIGGLTRSTFSVPFHGKIYELIFCNAVLSDVKRARVLHYLQNKYNPLMTFAALGDSITDSSAGGSWWSVGSNPLHLDEPGVEGVGFVNHAAGSETTVQALGRWNNDISANGYDGVVILSSINDIDNVPTPNVNNIFANLQQIIDDAIAQRMRVFVSTIMPFGNASSWTTTRQAALEDYNNRIRNKAAADTSGLLRLIESYGNFGEPADPTKLLAAYDSGDGLHPSAAGDTAFAELLKTQIEAMR